jgi:hypothetical protein
MSTDKTLSDFSDFNESSDEKKNRPCLRERQFESLIRIWDQIIYGH